MVYSARADIVKAPLGSEGIRLGRDDSARNIYASCASQMLALLFLVFFPPHMMCYVDHALLKGCTAV